MLVRENQCMKGSRRKRRRQARDALVWENYKIRRCKPNLTIPKGLEWFDFSEEDFQGVMQNQSDALVIPCSSSESGKRNPR